MQEQLKKAEELFLDMDVRRQKLKLSVDQLEERLLDVQVSFRPSPVLLLISKDETSLSDCIRRSLSLMILTYPDCRHVPGHRNPGSHRERFAQAV